MSEIEIVREVLLRFTQQTHESASAAMSIEPDVI